MSKKLSLILGGIVVLGAIFALTYEAGNRNKDVENDDSLDLSYKSLGYDYDLDMDTDYLSI
jgi:hypothetical protein